MTFIAGHIGMFPFQFEPCLSVIKIDRFPIFSGMASPAISNPLFLELVRMRILVAGGAIGG
jgi:hypothetical protein